MTEMRWMIFLPKINKVVEPNFTKVQTVGRYWGVLMYCIKIDLINAELSH